MPSFLLKYNKDKVNYLSLVLLSIYFLICAIVVPAFYSLTIPIIILGSISLYLFSPLTSFVYSFIFVIDPLNTFHLSGLSILPLMLCFTYIIVNYNKCRLLITTDPKLITLIKICFVFTLYQIFISQLLLGGPDFYYIIKNVNYWAGIWIIIPGYIFTIIDRKNLFASVLIIVLLIIVLYYLSFFNIYNFFEINEQGRSASNKDIIRYFSFDLRQITKIFVYAIPIFILYPLRNQRIKVLIIGVGFFVFISVLLALLRTEIFYLSMGAIVALLLSRGEFKSIGKLKLVLYLVALIGVINIIFPELLKSVVETIRLSIEWSEGDVTDASVDHRNIVQMPILKNLLSNHYMLGAGLFATSFEATGEYLLYDIPILGAFAAYGIIGMSIYYSRFYLIFTRYRFVNFSKNLYAKLPVELLFIKILMAYFITMITFRAIHINIELAFSFGMPEFGFFMGIFFGLTRFVSDYEKYYLLINYSK
jgi:hypothetical protein